MRKGAAALNSNGFCELPLREYFEHCVGEKGLSLTLVDALDTLAPGFSSAAFHGAIRVAFATTLEGGEAEVCAALAAWSASYGPLLVRRPG